jgi:glycine/D-amino acid oxidase-like deaminating enzyme/DNA invertase Pin-like site-specific DNA recombinase
MASVRSRRCVVIGAGVIGAAVASRLASSGLRVTLLDQDQPGRATSRWSFAWLNSNDKGPRHYHDLNHAGIRAWAELAPDLDGAAWYRPVGNVELATSDAGRAELAGRVRRLTEWGYPAHLVDAAEVPEVEPSLRQAGPGATAAFFPDEGYLLPQPLIGRLVAYATSRGAVVLTGEQGRVAGFDESPCRVRTTAGAVLEADEVVCCAGRWVPALAAMAGAASLVPLVSWDTPGATAPSLVVRAGPVTAAAPVRLVHTPEVCLRPHSGSLLHLEAPDAAVDLHTPEPELRRWATELLRRARRTVRGLDDARVTQHKVCVRPMPADGQSIVGRPPGAEWLYIAVTHSGVTLVTLAFCPVTVQANGKPIDIYARRSRKGDRQQRSTSGQVQACRSTLAERDLPAGEMHVDDGRSAWNPRVHRPGWDALMARLESGASGGVIVFDLERFSRQPIEGERLIQAADRGLVVLDSDAEFDLTTASGKKSFRDAMSAAAYYSDRLSDRVRRGKRLKAVSGEPHGRVSAERGPFGFMPDGITPHSEEAGVLREITARFLAGETQDALIADLNGRGIVTATGGKWTRRSLHDVLVRPLNAGLVVHRGEIVAALPGEPVITRDDHERVIAMYAARRPGRPASGAYLCSGSVVCGLCGKPLGGRPRSHLRPYPDGEVRREYWCTRTGYGGCGHVSVDQRALDDAARELAIEILADVRHAAQVEAAVTRARNEAARLDKDIAELEELALTLGDRLGRGEITLERYDAITAPLDKRLVGLRARRAGIGTAGSIPAVPAEVWRQRWDDADPSERRELLRAALRGRKIVIGRAGPGDRGNVMARITIA